MNAVRAASEERLRYASKCGDLSTVQELLLKAGSGLNVDACDENQMTALHFAAEAGHMAVVRLLIELGEVNVMSENNSYFSAYQVCVFRQRRIIPLFRIVSFTLISLP